MLDFRWDGYTLPIFVNAATYDQELLGSRRRQYNQTSIHRSYEILTLDEYQCRITLLFGHRSHDVRPVLIEVVTLDLSLWPMMLNMIWYLTWHDMTWHDMTWHDMAWHGMAWHGTTRHDTIWYPPQHEFSNTWCWYCGFGKCSRV